ncbi:MAG: hypothetical protein J6Q50_01065 [Clostridia bacterium]|nr:hypothetical protein [Clostridia bacterium]
MKKAMRIFSIALALVLMCTALVIPTSAADVNVKFEMSLAPVVGEVDEAGVKSEDAGIYKLTINLTSDCRMATVIMDVNYDDSLFAPVDSNNGSINYEYVCDPEFPTVAIFPLGQLTDTNMYNSAGNVVTSRGQYYGGGHKTGSFELKADYKASGTVLLTYEIGDKTLMPGTMENEGFCEIYFKALVADVEGAQFSFGAGTSIQDSKSIGYDSTPVAGKFFSMTASNPVNILPVSDILTPDYTYTAPAAPELSVSWFKNQIRFDLDKEGVYANQFDYRIVGQFDNFEEIFADLNDAKAKITDVGYVFTNSEVMDVEAAKAQVEGGEVVYSQVKDCYVSTTFEGTDYAFACFVSNIADTDANKAATLYGLGYVIYENADGETAYAYYDATLNVGALYNQYK